jgi:tetratricopeptide (TPR) repeat protein
MREAAGLAGARSRAGESTAWYEAQVAALYFNSGRHDDAEHWYAAALATFPDYRIALAGLGDVSAANGDVDLAISYYERAVARVPEPAFLTTLGDLHARAGNAEAAQDQYDTLAVVARLAASNGSLYNRELVIFYADHGIQTAEAARLALNELAVRKDIYGYDTAAWALYADGRPREAEPLIEQALRLGTQDARLFYHAGMIARANGDKPAASAHLERALDINPHFSTLGPPQASAALEEIERALALGR